MNSLGNDVGDVRFERRVAKYGRKKIIATNNAGQKLGFVQYVPSDCELFEIEVKEQFRRHGIGSKLFQECMNDLKSHGCNEARWMATSSSIPFYYQQGASRSSLEHPNLGLTGMYKAI